MESQQLPFDFSKSPLHYKKGQIKELTIKLVSKTVERINREKDDEKRWRLKIIKKEFSQLADEL